MMIAVLALVAALQSQTPAPVVQVTALSPAESTPSPAPAATPAPVEADAMPEVEAEPVAAEPRTRQVCRYVEVPGRRFPARRCRTVPVED